MSGACGQARALKQQANALADSAAEVKFGLQTAQQEGDELRGLIVEVIKVYLLAGLLHIKVQSHASAAETMQYLLSNLRACLTLREHRSCC